MGTTYDETYKHSIENPQEFWAEAAKKVHWYNEWDTVLDCSIALGFEMSIADFDFL